MNPRNELLEFFAKQEAKQITPAEIRATCDAHGWIPIGDGYYHPKSGTKIELAPVYAPVEPRASELPFTPDPAHSCTHGSERPKPGMVPSGGAMVWLMVGAVASYMAAIFVLAGALMWWVQ